MRIELSANCIRVAAILSLIVVLATATCFTDQSIAAQGVPQTFEDILRRYDDFDINADGNVEIKKLQTLSSLTPAEQLTPTAVPKLLVLIEQRLLDNDRQLSPAMSLEAELKVYAAALQQDQLQPIFVSANLEKSQRHQDGWTLLSLRRCFQDLRNAYPDFQGVILIGSFPESMLVRRWAWLHSDRQVKFGDLTYNRGEGPKATYLAFDPELISHRSDVVLCDLDGNWEDIYVQPRTEIDSIKLIPDDPKALESIRGETVEFTSQRFSIHPKSFEDFFFIDDAQFEIKSRSKDSLTIQATYEMKYPEIGKVDRQLPTPVATPDLLVSRINALHIAANPPEFALDEKGQPQAFEAEKGIPSFRRSTQLERQLLIEYLQRNVRHRQGLREDEANRSALLTTDIRTFDSNYLQRLSDQFEEPVAFHRANVIAFTKFMKTPAIVKGISAHSGPSTSVLINGYEEEALQRETGGHYWEWKKTGEQFLPSYSDRHVCNSVNTSLLRTLWANKLLPKDGTFYIHGGCEAISPLGAATQPYHSLNYGGHTQIAESLLFYGNGLSLIGRAKVFYDCPRNPQLYFSRQHGRFGEILRGYFSEEANDAKPAGGVAGRNRCYFWSIIGDWTLRLDYAPAKL